jgi:serine/threonine protein kinase
VKCIERQEHQKAYANEVAQLSRVHHPNIIELLGVYTDRDGFSLVVEYLEDGSLFDLLHRKTSIYR